MEEDEFEKDMTPILLEDLGMRFANEGSKKKYRLGLYECQYCGREWEANTQSIKQGKAKSCGCLGYNLHGLSYHPLYAIWNMMKARCYNPKGKNYKDYGGRGIQVCERWLDIKNFIEDMYPSYQEGLSLDRIDVNGNYEPNNCRWSTRDIQVRNTRDIQSNNTSGFRGVSWHIAASKWVAKIKVNNKNIQIGSYLTALEAGKAYETYVRLNNLEHNFTPALTEEEIEELNKTEGI